MKNQLEIDFAIGRDVTDENIDEILGVLDDWWTEIILIYGQSILILFNTLTNRKGVRIVKSG